MCKRWFHVSIESKLKEYEVEEKDVLKILTQVNVTRRECEIVRTLLLLDLETMIQDQSGFHTEMSIKTCCILEIGSHRL